MARKITKNDCVGCHSDFYNYGGVTGDTEECWSFKNAKMIKRKKVHINQRPPWNQKATLRPSCYHAPNSGYVYVNNNTTH